MDKVCHHSFVGITRGGETEILCRWCGLKPPTLYTIKPLEWEEDTRGAWYADGVGSHYSVFYSVKAEMIYMRNPHGSKVECTSIEDGKKQAQEHYEAQLLKCLEVYDG